MNLVNPLRRKLTEGRCLFGTLATMPSPQLAQLFAGCGFDWLMIDMEHGTIGIESAQAMIAATAVSDCVPLVRVAWNLDWLVKPALDAGALGIVFPMIRTAEDAAAAVACCRYPPHGTRGWGPFHAPSRWGTDALSYTRDADAAVMRIALIEHVEAIANIEAIVATEGLDVALIAPFDLSVSLGVPGRFDEPVFREAVAAAERVIADSPVVLGGLARDAEAARALTARGYRFVLLAYDVMIIEGAARALLDPLPRG